jgi:Na+/H+-dicarboxylate symporter
LRCLKFLILPLISSSLITGIAGLNACNGKMGKIALRAVCFYASTTFIAAILGLLLVISIEPGSRVKITNIESLLKTDALNGRKINPIDTILDLIRNLFPGN